MKERSRRSPAPILIIFFVIALLVTSIVLSRATAFDIERLFHLAEQRYGKTGLHAIKSWQKLQQEALPLPMDQKLEKVNTFINRHVLYVDDRLTWGKNDYWATPLETLGLGQGDCEDFTLAKYMTLYLLGIPVEKLRLTYVKANILTPDGLSSQAHMVLSYYPEPNREPLILDNLNPAILPASKRRDLHPIFSFNTEQLWVSGKKNSAGDPSSRLSNWQDVLTRMHQEGLE